VGIAYFQNVQLTFNCLFESNGILQSVQHNHQLNRRYKGRLDRFRIAFAFWYRLWRIQVNKDLADYVSLRFGTVKERHNFGQLGQNLLLFANAAKLCPNVTMIKVQTFESARSTGIINRASSSLLLYTSFAVSTSSDEMGFLSARMR
jgi:hypothetical protein